MLLGPVRRYRGMARTGFTLVELLVVLLVLVLAIGVAAPRIGSGIDNAQLKQSARQFASALRHARGKALAEGADSTVTLDTRERHYRISGAERRYTLPEGVEVQLETARSELGADGVAAVRFFPDGTSTGAKVTLMNDSRTYIIQVNWLTGQVRILD